MSVATAILALLAVAPASGIKVWDTPGDIPTTIPAKCRVALSSNLEFGPRLVRPAELASLGSLSESLLTQYCNSTCTASMKVSNVSLYNAVCFVFANLPLDLDREG
ncbi:hypothetical protein PC129_g25233 [Phytophthora cactorum]|uniref:Elicitin n=1 Tax=Phytophthora cactorum TaxID=29920 RepID=A0A8T1H055_9STRA|nr:hypothetical protein PC129_g25233 [Phytophthora cactorum]